MFIEATRQLIAEFKFSANKSNCVDPNKGILRELPSRKHPERREGEAFLGYWTPAVAENIPWRSKRIGNRVYDEHGNLYPQSVSRNVTGVPVFANALEVAQGIRRAIWIGRS